MNMQQNTAPTNLISDMNGMYICKKNSISQGMGKSRMLVNVYLQAIQGWTKVAPHSKNMPKHSPSLISKQVCAANKKVYLSCKRTQAVSLCWSR